MRQLVTTLVFLRRGDELLLAMKKRGHGQGSWNGVGGKVESGETIEQAMIRECHEEISVVPLIYQKMAELEFFELYQNEATRNLCHAYLCTQWQGDPVETAEMVPLWFSTDAIPYDHMWPDDRYWLAQIVDGCKLRGIFRYNDENTLQSHELATVEQFP